MKISAASQRPTPFQQFTGSDEIAGHICAAIRPSAPIAKPWPHWLLAEVWPREVLRELTAMPLTPAIAKGPSGCRKYRNQQRIYFDAANMTRFPPMRHVA